MTVNTKNIVPREPKRRDEEFLEREVQRRILVEQTRALANALASFRNTCTQAPDFLAGRSGRLDARRIEPGKRHGLAFRDAAAFSQAAAEYARNAPWLERAVWAARRRKEWWMRRFRPWDMPGLRRLPSRRDRILAWNGAAFLLLSCAAVGWWMNQAPAPGHQTVSSSGMMGSRDIESARNEAERAALAFLQARDVRERAIYLREGRTGRRPAAAPSSFSREWSNPRITQHWAEALDRGMTGHWLRVADGIGDRTGWVAVVTKPSEGGIGWTAQIDAEAMEAYQTGAWNVFLDDKTRDRREVFRLLARSEPVPSPGADSLMESSFLVLHFTDALKERECVVRLLRSDPAYSRWCAGDLAAGSPGRERPVTVELERVRSNLGESNAVSEVRLVSVVADGWIVP